MNRFMFAVGMGSGAAAAALAFSGSAVAEPEDPAPAPGGTSAEAPNAAEEVARLQAEGKSVHVVGAEGGAMLENCEVANTTEGEQANTVMVEVSCGLNYP